MRLLTLLLFLLVSWGFKAQERKTFVINWEQETDESFDVKYWSGLNIQTQYNRAPLFLNQWEKQNKGEIKSFSFENIIEKKIQRSETLIRNIDEIPLGFNPIVRIVKEGNNEFYSVEATPLYKNDNGDYIQITSFEVSYELSSSQSRISITEGTSSIENSVLSTGTWYKIAVDKTGVFKIGASFLSSIGINISELDPKKIRVFGNGGGVLPELLSEERKEGLEENGVLVYGEEDGSFDSNDYVLFYAQGPIRWELDSRLSIEHKQNIYSDYAYYFINVDSGIDGKRISQASTVTESATVQINTFTDYKVHEEDSYNYLRTGKDWFGEDFSVNSTQDFSFQFDNLDTRTSMFLRGRFSAAASTNTVFSVDLDDLDDDDSNNEQLLSRTIAAISGSNQFYSRESSTSFNSENDNVVLNVNWNNNGDLSGEGYLDYLEVIADRYLIANGSQFSFTNFNSNITGNILEYTISNKSEIDYIWDVSDNITPYSILDLDSGAEEFVFKTLTDGELDKYQLVKVSDAYSPISLGDQTLVANQNLHSLENVQYLIIAPKDFTTQAMRLANYHKENTLLEGFDDTYINVEVVELEAVYNEFGSGSQDITAIRDFVKFIYDKDSNEETRLKYLCLFGDASFDYRGRVYDQVNIVPAYLAKTSNYIRSSYNSDDYYAFLDATDDIYDDDELSASGKLDIVTGRIPASSTEIAEYYVDKILRYYSSDSYGDWKNKITLLGDDGKNGDDENLIEYLENSALKIEDNNKNLNLTKLYTDAFTEVVTSGGGTYPEINKRFEEAFNLGSLVINYFGHGSTSLLGEENFLDIPTIKSFRNLNNLPLFITITCDFTRFDDPSFLSAGEELLNNQYGGVSSMITTTREIGIQEANIINGLLADYLYSFDGETRTIAEALKDVKNNISYSDELFVYFMGDPAMKMSIPEEGVLIDKVEKYIVSADSEETILEEVTELNGLSKLKVTGRIVKKESVLNSLGSYDVDITQLEDFNGSLSITLFDKEIERETLLNEATTSGNGYNESNVVEFKSLENKVFVGNATIQDGAFSFDFILPKDVSSIPEQAKFSFYAYSNSEEKTGSDFSYNVGGIDNETEEDNTPPTVNLFMEDETFIDGGNTSSTPILIAKLFDESGINTSLNSIGHNISLVIDGDLINPISLNEYYSTEKDDFTNGLVTYELSELSEGNHTITLKVWDSHNNSSTQTLSFFVEQDQGFRISRVLNYPNPFVNHTEFYFKNNREGSSLEIKAQIFTVSGKLVKTIFGTSSNSDGNVTEGVAWDGKDDFGNKLGKGVYIYKLTVKEMNSGESDERIEKLVLL